MKTAKLVKSLTGFLGDARLYKLSHAVKYDEPWGKDDPPARSTRFVVVSAIHGMFGAETYIFPANASGAVVDWGELNGSGKGSLTHEWVLKDAGFKVVA